MRWLAAAVGAVGIALLVIAGCDQAPRQLSASGLARAQVAVPTNSAGLTIEQQNIHDRLLADNKPGAIKHLYVISAYSGQVLIYSTVRGKVTSGGKRLTPSAINGHESAWGFPLVIGDNTYYTDEVLGDDGTYGASGDYLYWWDAKGVYHQHYLSGGQIVHISDQPLAVKSVILNMELSK